MGFHWLMSGLLRWYCGILLGCVAALMGAGPAGAQLAQAKADAGSCAVYRAFMEYRRFDALFVDPRSAGFTIAAGPGVFEKQYEVAPVVGGAEADADIGVDVDPALRWRTEEYAFDTRPLIGQLAGAGANLRDCFGPGRVGFVDPDSPISIAVAVLKTWSRSGYRVLAPFESVQFSPVAFAGDGRHALIFVTTACWPGGGLCGSGSFELFVRKGDAWDHKGGFTLWIS